MFSILIYITGMFLSFCIGYTKLDKFDACVIAYCIGVVADVLMFLI